MRLNLWSLILALAVLSGLSLGCQSPKEQRMQVFCAASLSGIIEETAKLEKIPLNIHSGGSRALIRQVLAGAKADLLLLAEKKMAQESLVPQGYRLEDIASNSLVVIAPASDDKYKPMPFPQALAGIDSLKLAIADPQTAPLGSYTASALSSVSLKPKTIPLSDATAVVSAVALGHADLGIVYTTDASSQKRVKTISNIPTNLYPPVLYVAALPAKPTAAAEKLVRSLQSGMGRKILAQNGFLELQK